MPNNRDQFVNTRIATALAQVVISADEVQNGLAIPVGKAVGIALVLEVFARTTGEISIQDVQFADDAAFTINVDTYTSDDILMKNDRCDNDNSAIAQTLLAAAGRRKLSFENRALDGQKFFRVRTISADTAALTANVIAVIGESVSPVLQG